MKIDSSMFYFSLLILAKTQNLKVAVVVDRSEFETIKGKIHSIFDHQTVEPANRILVHDIQFKNQIKFLPTKSSITFCHSKESIIGSKIDHIFFLKDEMGYDVCSHISKFLVRNSIIKNSNDK